MDARQLVRYNHAARRRMAEFFVDEVPWEVLVENHETSHQNIANAFMHGCNMEDWWLHYIVPGKEWDGPRFDGFTNAKSIRDRVLEVERKTQALLAPSGDEDLRREQDLSAAGTDTRALTLEQLLIEVALEDIHHRGEILAMLWRKDIEPPYVSFAEWSASAGP